jgi:hypothetical protein
MSHWLNQKRLVIGAVALLFLLPYLVFWQVWFPFNPTPLLFEHGDFVEQNVAMRRFVAGELREGRLPLWDPYTYAGQPALSGSLFAPYYPLGWWQTLFPYPFPDWVLPVEVIFHLGVGGVGAFLLVCRLTGNHWAGVVSGITFELSGWATGYPMLQVGILETAVWLPWGLWFIERGLARQQWADMARVALVYGIALLAGHPQTLLYLAYLSAAYYLYRAYHYRVGWQFGIGSGVLITLGVLGLGAAQWLPAIEAYTYSPRLGLRYEEVGNGFQWGELIGSIAPDGSQWLPLYVGQVEIISAFVGVLFLFRKGEIRFWLITVIVTLLLSLGMNGFLYPIAHCILPGFAIFRNQERIALIYMMAVVILGGYGYAFLLASLAPTRRLIFLLLSITLTFLNLAVYNGAKVLQEIPQGYYPPSPIIDHLRSVGDATWRISSEGLLPDGPNAGMVYRVRDVVGNSPLHLAALDDFTDTVPEIRWWQLLNVQHILTKRTFPENTPVLPIMSSERGTLYQVFVNATPVWITHQYEIVDSQSAAIARTAAPDIDPFQTVILEQVPALIPAPATVNERATVSIFEPQRLVTEITLTTPAVVVWSEIAYSGWVVQVNGENLATLRAYGLLRAVALPAGEHTVEWRFEPPLVYWGLGISTVAFVLLMAITLRQRTKH